MTQKGKRKNDQEQRQRQLLIFGGIVGVVAVLGALLILTSASDTPTSDIDYGAIPQSRTADGGYVLGDPDAPVTIVAFEDFLCPHCQSYQDTIHTFIENHVATGQARFEFRMLPAVDPTYSALAFRLAECAEQEREGSFWQAHDTLFAIASGERFDGDSARKFAEQMNMAYGDLLRCANSGDAQWQTDQQVGDRIGVDATPTVVVRFGDGPLQPNLLGTTRPNAQQLAAFVASYQ